MRVRAGIARNRKKRRIRNAAKGFRGGRSKLLRQAMENAARALRYSYIGRKEKKRDFRRLWIERINAAARERGLTYSAFIGGLAKGGVEVNRPVLAELALADPGAFDRLVEVARENL